MSYIENWMIESYISELKKTYYISEENYTESLDNLLLYLRINLIKREDIIFDRWKIKSINKIKIKYNMLRYDDENYPISIDVKKYKLTNNYDINKYKINQMLEN